MSLSKLTDSDVAISMMYVPLFDGAVETRDASIIIQHAFFFFH